MGNLDFYYAPASEAPFPMNDGDLTHRQFKGTLYDYENFDEILVREGAALFYYYCYHPNSSQTTYFIYPSDHMSEMFGEIIFFIDKYNFPSVKEQWPHFAKGYENAESGGCDKIMIKKIQNWQNRFEKDVVFMITVDKYIPFEPTYTYRHIIHKLVDFANLTINEVMDDNGCLNYKGQVKSFLRGAREGSFLGRLLSWF